MLLLLPALLHAQSHGLEVRPANEALLSVAPRNVVTVAFRVTNGTGQSGQFEAHLETPPGWRLITPEFPFELAAGETSVRFISLFIPAGARAGEYPLAYAVSNRQQPAIRDAYSLSVRVLPALKLQVEPLDVPEFVMSGDSYKAAFLVRNRGNAPLTVEYKAGSSHGYPTEAGAGTLALEPGESKRVEFQVSTEAVRKPEQDRLTLTARVHDKDMTEQATSVIQILPRSTGVEQVHNTIPAYASLSFVTQDRGGEHRSGWQTEVSGGGVLDEAEERHIGFLLRGPDVRHRSSLGLQDEYRVDYSDKRRVLSLGDRVYALSPLTENGRYGRGASASYQFGRLGFSAYQMEDRFSSEKKQQTAINASYLPSDTSRLDVNFLSKQDGATSDIFSLRNQAQWAPGFNTDLELAESSEGSKGGQAFRSYLSDTRDALRYSLTLISADPQYRGYYADQKFGSADFDYPIDSAWALHGYYRTQRTNLDADPIRAAPEEKQASFGSNYRLSADTSVGVDYTGRAKLDRRALPDFDAAHHGARLGVQQQYGTLSLSASGEWGTTEDQLRQDRFPTRLYLISTNWRATERQSYGAYLFYDDNTYSTRQQAPQSTVGINTRYLFFKATSLDLNVQRGQAQAGNDLCDVRLNHHRDNGHLLALVMRHATAGTGQTDMLFTYTVPFNLPASRKKGVTMLRGRIVDAETGKGVPNIVLRLGSLIAVSEENGHFTFPSVKPGSYHLSIDGADAASGKVPANPLPMAVEIRQDFAELIDIALIRGATLSGEVMAYEGEGQLLSQDSVKEPTEPDGVGEVDKPRRALAHSRGVQNLLVVLRSGERVYKRLTDGNGRFRLAGLPPGKWIASIEEEDLPAGFELQKKQAVVELTSGAEAAVEFRLMPEMPRLKMLESLGTIK